MIKYNSLYQSLRKVSADWHAGILQWSYSWFYLKFYEDGTVIKTYLNGENFEKINVWLTPNANGLEIGKFVLDDNYKIVIKFNDGTLIEGAVVNPETILLQGKSNWEAYFLKA